MPTPVTPGPVVGKDCKLYYNSGTNALPVWVEVKHAINATANLGKGEADVSSRAVGWKLSKGGLKELEVSFTYRHLAGADTVFDAILASYTAGTPKQFAVMDADITSTGAQGVKAYFEVFQLNQSQELENAVEYEVTMKPTYFVESSTVIEPTWFEVA